MAPSATPSAARPAPRRSRSTRGTRAGAATPPEAPATSVAAALGVQGWAELDPVLLGALALEAPVLLIGEHGTAKTLIVERIAAALGAEFRHYNASLVNYDDLVGIPIPDDHGGLRFVGTVGSVWDAEFVFFDEINRCRPDLQNKMFPIVHERRVAGVGLPRLVHRWAAMNPPGHLDGLADYVGVEPLDRALADRFWFTVRVPTWDRLSRDERAALVSGVPAAPAATGLGDLVTATRQRIAEIDPTDGHALVPYVVLLVDLLNEAGIHQSPRRAAMLRQAIVAVHAASQVLGRTTTLGDDAELVVRHALPQWADAETPGLATVVGAHQQAFAVTVTGQSEIQLRLFEERDPVQRLALARDLGADEPTLGLTVLGALQSLPDEAHRRALAVVVAEAFGRRSLTPAAWSAVAERAAAVRRPSDQVHQIAPGRQLEAWRRATAWLEQERSTSPIPELERALIHSCGPSLLADVDIAGLGAHLRRVVQLFGWSGR